jgi:dihydrofolate synthase/folylpolyglutamate synthase
VTGSLAWLFDTQFFGIKLGLDNTRALLGASGNPQFRPGIFHVAGTNGKGSVCAMLDAIFRAGGLRSGLYTSPHLCDFCERVRVDGQMIPPETTEDILAEIRRTASGLNPTFFEIATVLALTHFAREGCEAVALETGMGGRLDATNAVTPLVSVITPIAMDHAQWLGATVEEIAAEKAGIIKPGIPVVSAPQEPGAAAVISARALELGCPLEFVGRPYAGDVGLCGEHQKWNAALAAAAVRTARPDIGEAAVAEGLRGVSWPARFQRIGGGVVVDGAHNPHAAESLVATWKETFGAAKATVIFGALGDKDPGGMTGRLAEIAREFYFVPVASPRSTDPGTLSAPVAFRVFPSLARALEAASRPPVLITGSLFLAGEALSLLLPASFVPCNPGRGMLQ